jgi:hypothetical protein
MESRRGAYRRERSKTRLTKAIVPKPGRAQQSGKAGIISVLLWLGRP